MVKLPITLQMLNPSVGPWIGAISEPARFNDQIRSIGNKDQISRISHEASSSTIFPSSKVIVCLESSNVVFSFWSDINEVE